MKTLKLVQILFLVTVFAKTSIANTVFVEGRQLKADEVTQNKVVLKRMLPRVSEQARTRFAEYLTSIGLSPKVPFYKKEMTRILEGSTQFVFCPDLDEWSCLESFSPILPFNKSRQDLTAKLGVPRNAGASLDIEYYFTQGWYINFINRKKKLNADYIIPEKTVAKILAQKIHEEGQKNIWMAIYGIDDITGTMSSVYNAIKEKFESGTEILAVADVSDDAGPNSFIRDYDIHKLGSEKYSLDITDLALDYSYVSNPNTTLSAFESPAWMLQFMTDIAQMQKTMKPAKIKEYILTQMFIPPAPEILKNPTLHNKYKMRILDLAWIAMNTTFNTYKEDIARTTFEYGNTLQLIRMLNSKARNNLESRAHLEFPFKSIMHNKFLVFENANGQKSVWTGTANVAKTCMGSEENSNLSVFIRNEEIAKAFLDEFNEMFTPVENKSLKPSTLSTGLFHDRKKPNTQRYFTFDDRTEVRLHFSPTDDGEHRVLLPLIYSARAGDILRISMFGAGGYEYVRAMQAAAVRGVDVRIVLDAFTGSGVSSWFQDSDANIFGENIFSFDGQIKGKIEVRLSDWTGGFNHHKSATLTRQMPNGDSFPETLIVGSQNWSQSGNDLNDENMMAIRNKTKVLEITAAFNKEFDEKLWPSSSRPDNATN